MELTARKQGSPPILELLDWVAAHPARRLVLAKRPGWGIPGLARLLLLGQARLIDESVLWDGPEAWPILSSRPVRDGNAKSVLADYLAEEVLADLTDDALIVLDLLSTNETAIAVDFDGEMTARCRPVSALIAAGDASGTYRLAVPQVRQALQLALARTQGSRQIGPLALRRAELLRQSGQLPAAILGLLDAGLVETALEWFELAGGPNFIYFHGTAAFEAVIDTFPVEVADKSDALVMAQALRALKSGSIESAEQGLMRHFGQDALHMAKVFSNQSAFPLNYRVFRCVLAIYEAASISDQLIERMFSVVEQLPDRDHLRRGNVYNALLEFYVRRRRLPEAESLAARALDHYQRANAPMLSFYVQLFQAVLASLQGDIAAAQIHSTAARTSIDSTGFESEKDYRILRLLDASIAYETGNAEPLATFFASDLDKFADSEIWPSLVEFTIQHGAQALSEHVSSFAALDFLDRWRIHRWPARSLRHVIEIREAIILQDGNRWLQAAAKLSALQSRINRTWAEAATDELPMMTDREEIGMLLAWMRSLVFETPTRPLLLRQIGLLLGNHNLTRRQRMTLSVWGAYVARRQNDLTHVRVSLLGAFEDAARLSCLAPLREEMVFLRELLADQRVVTFLKTSSIARQVLRRLEEIEMPGSKANVMTGLTRREARILLLIAEGGSNKFVARALEVSEATVKYHLTNLYRKLGCSGREQAIATARSLGWVT